MSEHQSRPIDRERVRDLARKARGALVRLEACAGKATPEWRREAAMKLCDILLDLDGLIGEPLDLELVRVIEEDS